MAFSKTSELNMAKELVRSAYALAVALLLGLLCALLTTGVFSQTAHAVTGSAAAKAMNTAYSRSAAAVKAYDTPDGYQASTRATYSTNTAGRTVIRVSIADLGLTKKQKQQVMDRVYYNSDNWYIDATGNGKFSSTELVYTCLYRDAKIPVMQKKLDAATASCLKLCQGASAKEKVHMIHDWIIKKRGVTRKTMRKHDEYDRYAFKKLTTADKLAYNPIVTGRGDCSGYTYAFDYLARKAGLKTAWAINMRFNKGEGHIWNMVKCGSKWYHVDMTWDGTFTCNYDFYYWNTKICHRYLMISDKGMCDGDHNFKGAWKVLKNGAKVSYKAKDSSYNSRDNKDWLPYCAITLKKGKTFTKNGLVFKVTKKDAKVVAVSTTSGTKINRAVPKAVWYRGHNYKVVKVS